MRVLEFADIPGIHVQLFQYDITNFESLKAARELALKIPYIWSYISGRYQARTRMR